MNIKEHVIDVPDVEKIGVYAIYNSVSDKYYIGSTTNIKRRLIRHRINLEKMSFINQKIKQDLKTKKDLENFSFLVLETFQDNAITETELRVMEFLYILDYTAKSKSYNYFYQVPIVMKIQDGKKLKCPLMRKGIFYGLPEYKLKMIYKKLKTSCDSDDIDLCLCTEAMKKRKLL